MPSLAFSLVTSQLPQQYRFNVRFSVKKLPRTEGYSAVTAKPVENVMNTPFGNTCTFISEFNVFLFKLNEPKRTYY